MFRVLCRVAVVLALLCAGISLPALAQSSVTGAISGTVRDPQEAIIPNASVTVRNEGTNQEQTATTDDEGRFRVTQLQPGNYTVTVNSGSFAPFTQQSVVVEVGQITPLDIALGITGGTAQVEVTAEAPVINTERQDFASNINQTSINELPINGRRASDFVRLTPGVVPDGGFGLNSFRGISGLLNNNTVDGGDNNNAFFSEERGRTRIPYSISQSAVREFQVNTSNYSAEYGRAAGGVVNTVTKSGTNNFHGDAFYYIRDNEVGARNPFSFQTVLVNGAPTIVALKPTDRRQQFGGTIGGPIVKDRLFFFFSYDQQVRNFPSVAAPSSATFLNAITITNPATRSVACTAANGTPTATLTPGETLFCRNISQAQADNGLSFLRSITGETPRTRDQTLFLPKIDWIINDANTFTATFNRLRANSPAGVQSQAVVNRGISSFGDDFVNVDSLILRLNSTISPTVLNEARFQYSRDNEFQTSQELSAGEQALLNRPGVTPNPFGRLPQINPGTGGFTFGQPDFLDRIAFPDERRTQFADTVTINKGRQTIKFGGDFNRVNDKLNNLFLGGGSFSFTSLADFLSDFAAPAGTPNTPTGTVLTRRFNQFQQAFGQSAFEFDTNDYNFFFQDDIRVDPRLTINVGLRYEFQQNPDAQIANPLFPQTSQLPSDKNNFGPRFGFAYDLTGDGKTSVRAGFGIYYGRLINSTISNAITNTGSATSQRSFTFFNNTAGAPTFPNVLTAAPTTAVRPNIVAFAPDFRNPQIYQGDFIVERELSRNTVISAAYLLSVGRNLPSFIDINLPAPVDSVTLANGTVFRNTLTVSGGAFDGQQFTFPIFVGARPNANFGAITQIQSDIDSQYDALVLQFNRRLTAGLQFQTNYTLAKATDSGQSSQTFTATNNVLNPFDRNVEKGTSNLDIRHRFVASAVFTPNNLFGLDESSVGRAIFNGFTIAPIVQIASGAPFNAFISGNATVPTGVTRIGSGILGAGGTNRAPFIERNAFRRPKTAVVDLRVSRRFNLGETRNIEILAEGFNIFNRTNVTNVGGTAFNVSGSTLLFQQNTFGVPNEAGNTIFSERQIQFALRFQF